MYDRDELASGVEFVMFGAACIATARRFRVWERLRRMKSCSANADTMAVYDAVLRQVFALVFSLRDQVRCQFILQAWGRRFRIMELISRTQQRWRKDSVARARAR